MLSSYLLLLGIFFLIKGAVGQHLLRMPLPGVFQALLVQHSWKACVLWLIMGLMPGKVHSTLGDPGGTKSFLKGIV